ncbi:hypothetical protein F4808DRAFT_199902 [Astrocystis sublimbata]|nr:hypothetical protein F4808DRAFT_199902 [Astrocystis sublimbata]
MAPETTAEAIANKRKRDLDEQGKRKRRRHERGIPLKPATAVTNGKPLDTEPSLQVNGLSSPPNPGGGMELDVIKTDGQIRRQEKHEKRNQRSKKRKGGALGNSGCTWKVSKPIGGRMLDIDPILTDDEKHMILAYNTSLQVYSAPESLLLRKIQLPLKHTNGRRDQIAAVCPSPTSPNLLWVASHGGLIWLLDWTTGTGSEAHIFLDCDRLHDMFVDQVKIGKHARDVLYASARKEDAWHIIAHDMDQLEVKESKTIFSCPSVIQSLRIAQHGQTFAAYAERDVILGYRKQEAAANFDDLTHEVVTLDASDEITCLDLQVTSRVHLTRKSLREASDVPVMDLVIGCARGAVFIYHDLIPQIRMLNTTKGHHNAIQPRKYHWHRKAVHAVKWSRDGNYVLSGGSESTLVLWQLDTQKKDFLPHLSASIENIVVSKHGASYALHLDDNSAIVLSTAEMKPITYVTGIQAMLTPRPISKDNIVKSVGQYPPDRLTNIPATISPSNPSQMLLCVGNGQQLSYSASGPSMPLMQVLDLTTMQSVSRQALTRTNPTDVAVTSSGHPITEPRVTGMKFSHNGRWLVTTDEWQPPSRDNSTLDGPVLERKESYLKFWSVSEEDQGLELMTRIDAPHRSGEVESLFDLAADPNSDRFATIGGDGITRLWQPTIRQRDGVLIKGKKGRQLYSWGCSQAISLYGNETTGNVDVSDESFRGSGAVAFSEDGSVLVCAAVHKHGAIVQVIDTESGEIRCSLDGLIKGDVQGISIVSTNLVVLSDTLMVYDLVLDELRYGVQLSKAKGSDEEEAHGPGAALMTHLATDFQTGRFAVAVSRARQGSSKVRSELAIFSPDACEPELTTSVSNPIVSLVSSVESSGFLILDSAAQLISVAESMDTKSLAFAQPLADLQLDQEPLENGETILTPALLPGGDDEPASDDEMDVDMADAADEDVIHPAVVAPQRLAELFDIAPSFAMPPIEDIFNQVAKMFSAKATVPV